MTGQDWIVLLSGTVGTFGFSLLFCLHGRQLPVTTAGGALACLLWLLCGKAGMAPRSLQKFQKRPDARRRSAKKPGELTVSSPGFQSVWR